MTIPWNQFPHRPILTVPVGAAICSGVALSTGNYSNDAGIVWSFVIVCLGAASGAAFVHGFRRWHDLRRFGSVSARASMRPVVVLCSIVAVALVLMMITGFHGGTWRTAVLVLVALAGFAPGATTVVGIGRLLTARADAQAAPPGLQIGIQLALGRMLQSLLAVMGGLIALLVVAEATSQRVTGRTSVEVTVLAGVNSSALVAVLYIPVAAKLRQRGCELVELCHPLCPVAADEIADALEKRARLEAALGIDRTLFSDVQANLIVVGPLLAGAAAAFL